MVVEIRDWCQNVGEYNTYNFCIWHFGLCVIVSKIDRCRSSDPPYEIAINPWWRGGRGLPSLIALFVIVSLEYLKLLKSAVTDHPQKDTFQSSSKVSVDPMRVLDSLMPSTTIEHLNRLSPLFSLSPVDITTIQMCLHTTDI